MFEHSPLAVPLFAASEFLLIPGSLGTAGAGAIIFYWIVAMAMGLYTFFVDTLLGLFTVVLFPAPPSSVGGLEGLWEKAVFAYFLILFVVSASYFGILQFSGVSKKAPPSIFASRVFASIFIVILSKYIIQAAFVLTNALGRYLFPSAFELGGIGTESAVLMGGLVDNAIPYFIGLILIYSGAIFTYGVLLVLLSMRVIVLYTFYVAAPILIALWVGNVGPLKYGHEVSMLSFKILSLLLALGVVVSVMMATGMAISTVGAGGISDEEIKKLGGVDSRKEFVQQGFTIHIPEVPRSAGLTLLGYFGAMWTSAAILFTSLGIFLTGVRGGRAKSAKNKVKSGAKSVTSRGKGKSSGKTSSSGAGGVAAGATRRLGGKSASSKQKGKRNKSQQGASKSSDQKRKPPTNRKEQAIASAQKVKKGLDKVDRAAQKVAGSGDTSVKDAGKKAYGKARERKSDD